MRIGLNPHKDQLNNTVDYLHQVVVPVYIPNHEGYFKDSFKILQRCLNSLFDTVHDKTFITVVNNGSCDEVKLYLNTLHQEHKIQEVIHTENIGKLNAIVKGLVGIAAELVTITDADVLFLPKWQESTTHIFKILPKVGVVGIVPQFNMFKSNCGAMILDHFFSKKLKFIPVKAPEGMINFYNSIGWDTTYNKDFLKYTLGYDCGNSYVYVGAGHFVATYKKHMFDEVKTFFDYKLGGKSESFLDDIALKYGYWRVTTYDNYAYHMGNVMEDWMSQEDGCQQKQAIVLDYNFARSKAVRLFVTQLMNNLISKFLWRGNVSKWFYRFKKLPSGMISNYNNIVPK